MNFIKLGQYVILVVTILLKIDSYLKFQNIVIFKKLLELFKFFS